MGAKPSHGWASCWPLSPSGEGSSGVDAVPGAALSGGAWHVVLGGGVAGQRPAPTRGCQSADNAGGRGAPGAQGASGSGRVSHTDRDECLWTALEGVLGLTAREQGTEGRTWTVAEKQP